MDIKNLIFILSAYVNEGKTHHETIAEIPTFLLDHAVSYLTAMDKELHNICTGCFCNSWEDTQ